MELHENWKLVPFTIPIHLFITSIKAAGRYFALVIFSVLSDFYSHKSSKRNGDFDVLSWIPSFSPQVNVHVNVLLHELYPAKQASAADATDRNERLPPQDFIQALQKIDLEGDPLDNVDGASFVFQPTSTCSTSWTFNPHSKLGAPSDESVDPPSTSRPASSPTLEPLFSPVPGDPAWPDTDRVDLGTTDAEKSAEVLDLVGLVGNACDPMPGPTIQLPNASFVTLSNKPPDPSKLNQDKGHACVEKTNCLEKRSESLPLCITDSTQPVWINEGDVCQYPEFKDVTVKPEPTTSHTRVLRLNPNLLFGSNPTESDIKSPECGVDPVTSSDISRASRRKSVLKPLNIEGIRSRSASFSSSSDLELLSGSSLDSGLCNDLSPFNVKQGSSFASSSKSCGSLCATLVDPPFFGVKQSRCSSPHQSLGTTTSDTLLPSRAFSKREDCYQRDVAALEQAKVPFSYEEIINCSNERFRELKSTPYLTQHQLDVMLDARKRATNRLAAERCRRLKLATRDDLSEQLAALRLERQVLVRQVAQARQRKQRASDALLTEQRRILSLLRDSEGDNLKYSDWRVRLTHDDEVVVVAVGR